MRHRPSAPQEGHRNMGISVSRKGEMNSIDGRLVGL
jgi:hypothetical protein